MVQGWRPCSATHQPVWVAIQGSGRLNRAHFSSQGFLSSLRRVEAQKAQMNSASISTPLATMMRKVQNRLATPGMVSRAAWRTCSGVAVAGSLTYFFNSRP